MQKSIRSLARLSVGLLALTGASLVGVPAAQAAGGFTQCPSIGASPSCGILLTFNADGSVSIIGDPAVGPYDGIEDTLVGVQNNSGVTLSKVSLSSDSEPIFGFDGDGICEYTPNSGCAATGYEGPNTAFVVQDDYHGDVLFPAGLPTGGSTYFALEERLSAADIVIPIATASGTALQVASYKAGSTGTVSGTGSQSKTASAAGTPASAPQGLAARGVTSTATIAGGSAQTDSSVGTVSIPGVLSLTGVGSTASASCGGSTGSSSFGSGTVAGRKLTGPVVPNRRIPIGPIVVVLNEQIVTADGISVSAVHVTGPGLNIVVAQSAASVDC
ncbi:hypothetical protein GCM10022215_01690 [Nocardioides fonticola]|uniref:Secreted protein n=1 Tax=Nocardioides fonticola TaxID=450363 RepID=A0ABP7X9D3_9ACTN